MRTWSVFDSATLIIGAMLFVAYANGANDNFKGVATLFGGGVSDYRNALWWATATTLAGSLAAFLLAGELIPVFQGRGLVPPSLVQSPAFLGAVLLGAALTVFTAAKIGMPISTTHSLTGALIGGGIAAAGFDLTAATVWQSFFLPLLVSPLVALAFSAAAFPLLNEALRLAGIDKQTCVCVGNEVLPAMVGAEGFVFSNASSGLRIIADQETLCVQRLTGNLFGVNVHNLIEYGHYLSAGAVSFARGLNDTPKIVALGLAAGALNIESSIVLVAVIMALGGLLNARKVAETVSKRITAFEANQGFLANLVTSVLVIFASKWGLPVSTTHVSCGALFGIGAASGQARWEVIRTILLAWLLTLPFAALSAGVIYLWLSQAAPA
jgi:PiT family inorganic phosphate transporter